MTTETIQKLEEALKQDFTIEEACRYALISSSTYHEWMKQGDDFRMKMEAAKDYVAIKAKKLVLEAIESGDLKTAKWYLEKTRSKQYGDKAEEKREMPIPIIVRYVDGAEGL